MFKAYIKIAWRSLLKDRLFTVLNLVGLSAGLTSALLICLWLNDEWRTDRFNSPQLYRVMENRPHEKGVATGPETPAGLATALTANFPAVERAVVTTPPSWFRQVALSVPEKNLKAAALFAGADYFHLFQYPLLQGRKDAVLADPGGIVISEELAKQLFRTTGNVIGKTIHWQIDHFKKEATVRGIFKSLPHSSVQVDFVLPFAVFRDLMQMPADLQPQGPFHTYLLLRKEADVAQCNAALSTFMQQRSGQPRQLFLEPYADNYLYGKYENGKQAGGRITYVKLFALIGLFIILIACINFMNLATAGASGRLKEMGVRKTLGASRQALVWQYLGESMMMTFIAMLIALLAVMLLLPRFNEVTGKQIVLAADASLILAFFGIALFTGFLAGSYPALYLSGFNPVAALKGKVQRSAGELWTRKGLVVFQFSLSLIFIVGAMVIYRQIHFVQTQPLGYNKDQVIYFDAEGRVPEHMPAFLSALQQLPGVVRASAMVGNVQGAPSIGLPYTRNGHDETILFRPFVADYGMVETLGIEMAAGRPFSPAFGADSNKVIFNEAAIVAMGIKDPVGKTVRLGDATREIIGVTKNFHFQSMYETVKPLFMVLDRHGSTIMVKIQAGREQAVIRDLENFYHHYNPGFSFDYKFLDADYQAQYISEKRVAVLSAYAAGLTVLISCLGLFGLAAFTAEKRRKEISIRKILGATTRDIAVLLSRDFLQYVLVAICIAMPLAWMMMQHWLDSFAYHIAFGVDIFVSAAAFLLLITLITVSFQAAKAALANPAGNMKAE
ncbi:ABC transporter permease [Chitinophaga vietnamensis]|uniref:ABC transporter permease n=1 Tax=Chitinophaga vietnamensis TaxID=2593957 RepID=UPI001177A0ED|nr:ABC transporter permease [Chitinophaga vietnamensis]